MSGQAAFVDLEEQALRVRAHAIRMATNGGCFLGASLSCADLLVYLYGRVLRVAPDRLGDASRDYLLLSKGHDVPALYGTLAERGYFPRERLANHLSIDDHLYWHPNRRIPGVEFHSGSLGHLLSVGMGIALDAKLRGGPSRVFVVVGDGELDEGSVWEGALVAAAHKLDNLVMVVDRNGFQANVATEELVPLEPLADKLRAFGFAVADADGHSFPALAELGYIGRERLRNHLAPEDVLYWHPNRGVRGVEFHSGSLGHLLSVGMGVAADIRLRGGPNRVFVVLGDGELDEGSVWEALLVAHAQALDNLCLIIDRNGFQANVATEELVPLEPLDEKLRAFGCGVVTTDGHSFMELERAFASLPAEPGRPTAIIARTVRGKGVPSLEGRADRWFADFTPEEVEMLVAELHGRGGAELTSTPLVVR